MSEKDEEECMFVVVRPGTDEEELLPLKPTFSEMTKELTGWMLTERHFDFFFMERWNSVHRLKLEDGRDVEGRHFLHILCQAPVRSDAMEALDELIETFVEWCPQSATYTDQYGYTPLHYALYNSPRYKTVRVLLQKMDKGKAYLTGDTRSSLLLEACRNNCSCEIIRLLMRQTPFATIIPNIIPQNKAKVTYVHCLPI
jgi:hypothetical protein